MMRAHATILIAIIAGSIGLSLQTTTAAPQISGCQVFPADNAWNTRIDSLPVHTNSAAYVNSIGPATSLHPDFGSDTSWGIPYVVVSGTQARVPVAFDYADESDPGPYPIPANPPIEGGPGSTGDRHILMLDKDNHTLYELYNARTNSDRTWLAGSGAIFNLNSNTSRPDTWTSADAAGLPILPGLRSGSMRLRRAPSSTPYVSPSHARRRRTSGRRDTTLRA